MSKGTRTHTATPQSPEKCSCGRTPHFAVQDAGEVTTFRIRCRCGAETEHHTNLNDAVGDWNDGKLATGEEAVLE